MGFPERSQHPESGVDSLVPHQPSYGKHPATIIEPIAGTGRSGIQSGAEAERIGSQGNGSNLTFTRLPAELVQHVETETASPVAAGGQNRSLTQNGTRRGALSARRANPLLQQEQLGSVEHDSVGDALAPAEPERGKRRRLEISAPHESRAERSSQAPHSMRPEHETLNGAKTSALDPQSVHAIG